MIRLTAPAAVAFALAASVVQAQQGTGRTPNPQKLEKCRALASERGFSAAGGITKGQGRAKREFVSACMHGKQN